MKGKAYTRFKIIPIQPFQAWIAYDDDDPPPEVTIVSAWQVVIERSFEFDFETRYRTTRKADGTQREVPYTAINDGSSDSACLDDLAEFQVDYGPFFYLQLARSEDGSPWISSDLLCFSKEEAMQVKDAWKLKTQGKPRAAK